MFIGDTQDVMVLVAYLEIAFYGGWLYIDGSENTLQIKEETC